MKNISSKRKLRYGSISLILTSLVIAAVVILNIITAALCIRYDWMNIDMHKPAVYSISEDCRDYIEEYVISEMGPGEKIKITLCDKRENLEKDIERKYVLDSIEEIEGMFKGYIEIDYLDIWERPKIAASYGVTSTSDVICEYGDRHETMTITDFYVFENGSETASAYNGEKIIASCLMRVTQSETPMCYITVNHGETYGDYEFLRMIVESGYTVGSVDLYAQDIPEDCDMLVTFNPKQDMAERSEDVTVSEREKLDAYMSKGGKYMFFASADTFASGGFENFESFLSDWGISYRHETGDDGEEDCYLVRDTANSLTVDGYTVLAESAGSGKGADALLGMNAPNSFAKSTYIKAAEGYSADNGEYFGEVDGAKRTMSPLLLTHSSAEAWIDGRPVERASDEPFILMAMSTEECENGKTAYLIASASVDFAAEDAMQSSALGNNRTLTSLVKYMGKENAPTELLFKPFNDMKIQSLTVRAANTVTIVSCALPPVAALVLGTVVLVRRKQR